MSYFFNRGHLLRQQFVRDQLRTARRQASIKPALPTFADVIGHEFLLDTAKSLKSAGNYKAPGPDGVRFCDLSIHDLADICRDLHRALLDGSWEPSIAREVLIPKDKTSKRKLLIRTIPTQIVAAAIHQKLSPYWEATYVDTSYGFRAGRGITDMWLALERRIVQSNCWCLVQDDIRKAFDNVIISEVMEDHSRHQIDIKLVHVIEQLLRGHPSEQRQTGIDQGSSLSPDSLNVHLHYQLDAPLAAQTVLPALLRYADNLVVPAMTVSEGMRTTDRARTLLRDVGLELKGQDPPADLRRGQTADILGLQIRAETGRIRYALGDKAWQGLSQLLAEAIELDDPTSSASQMIQGWIAAYGPALAEARRTEVTERILTSAATYGITEFPRPSISAAMQAAGDRWMHLHAKHGLG